VADNVIDGLGRPISGLRRSISMVATVHSERRGSALDEQKAEQRGGSGRASGMADRRLATVRRLLRRGVAPQTLEALLPGWEEAIRRALEEPDARPARSGPLGS
jgi:hypothetical protein